MYAYIAYENADVTENIMKALQKGINDKPASEYRVFVAGYKRTLEVKDSLQQKRVFFWSKHINKILIHLIYGILFLRLTLECDFFSKQFKKI